MFESKPEMGNLCVETRADSLERNPERRHLIKGVFTEVKPDVKNYEPTLFISSN